MSIDSGGWRDPGTGNGTIAPSPKEGSSAPGIRLGLVMAFRMDNADV